MNELLQKLLEAEILTEDTKSELEEAFKTQLDEAIAAAKDEAAADVRAELTEQWVTEKSTLIEAIDSKVGEFLETEVDELKEDIERFRDLEAEYAEKLVEEKAAMGDELKSDLGDLVEKIDSFLEIRLASEIEELREDIDVVRKNEFGRKIFEAFSEEFVAEYSDEESAETSLRETEERLTDTQEQLEEAERKLSSMEREQKLSEVLAPLTGKSREVMEAILKNVDTKQLEEGYKTFIGRVLRETSGDDETAISEKEEKEDKVLAEGEKEETPEKKTVTETVLKTGDTEETLTENAPEDEAALQRKYRMQKLAGITS